MKSKIRKGDLVQVIAGEGRRPKPRQVLQVLDGGKRLVVEEVNRVYKHVKRNHPKSREGGRLSLELPIDASNVQLFCEHCQRGVRVGIEVRPDGSKHRVCRKCKNSLGQVAPPKS